MIQPLSNEDIVKVGQIYCDIEMKYRIPPLRFTSMLLIVETALLTRLPLPSPHPTAAVGNKKLSSQTRRERKGWGSHKIDNE
jgi:hypothetical protein